MREATGVAARGERRGRSGEGEIGFYKLGWAYIFALLLNNPYTFIIRN